MPKKNGTNGHKRTYLIHPFHQVLTKDGHEILRAVIYDRLTTTQVQERYGVAPSTLSHSRNHPAWKEEEERIVSRLDEELHAAAATALMSALSEMTLEQKVELWERTRPRGQGVLPATGQPGSNMTLIQIGGSSPKDLNDMNPTELLEARAHLVEQDRQLEAAG